jgi:hypothetical protein
MRVLNSKFKHSARNFAVLVLFSKSFSTIQTNSSLRRCVCSALIFAAACVFDQRRMLRVWNVPQTKVVNVAT